MTSLTDFDKIILVYIFFMKKEEVQFEQSNQELNEAIQYKEEKTNILKIIQELSDIKRDLEKMKRGTGSKVLLKEEAPQNATQVKVTAKGQARIQAALKMLKKKYPDYKVPGYDNMADDIFTQTIGETVHDKIFLTNLIESIEVAEEEYSKDVKDLTEEINKRCPDNREATNNTTGKKKRREEKNTCCTIY